MARIKLAIAGVGNCASSLLQGIEFYRGSNPSDSAGVLHEQIGEYRISDIQPVAAFDVDRRKVGQPLEKAIFAPPNCTTVFHGELPSYGVTVEMGPVLDGVAPHMQDYDERQAFRVADESPCDVAHVLRSSGAEVLICYLPVGSEDAVRHYARACLDAGVAMVNCEPVFIASHPEWAAEFEQKNLPVVGDDIKSQLGATIIHRTLARLMGDRGVRLERTYQLQHRRQHRLPQHAREVAAALQARLQDRSRPIAARRAARQGLHPRRPFRLRLLAERQQGLLPPHGMEAASAACP